MLQGEPRKRLEHLNLYPGFTYSKFSYQNDRYCISLDAPAFTRYMTFVWISGNKPEEKSSYVIHFLY
jgi:hypothetical protein